MKKAILLSLFALFFLTACGFAWRGTGSASLDALQQIQLNYAGSNNNELAALLQRRLSASGVDLGIYPEAYQLTLGEEQFRERVISVNRNVRAGEYELTLSTSFQLSRQDNIIFNREIISVIQIYEADPTNAAAKTNEAELIKTELRENLAAQIIRRLETVR